MIRLGVTVLVDRPVEEVFAFLTDPNRLAEWQTNVVSVTQESDGPVGPGTRFREVRRGPFGRQVESIVEVSAFERNRRFDLRIVSGPLPIDGKNELTTVGRGTRVRLVAEGDLRGPLRLARPILARLLRRQFESDYARLKDALESGGR